MANITLKSIQFPGLSNTYTIPQIDSTLAVSGKAADAKVTGDALASLQEQTTQNNAAFATDTAEGSLATFPDGADLVPVKHLTVDVEAVQSGSGDPSPSNVRPITGWSEAKVTRTGKNLLDPDVLTVFGATYVSSLNYSTEGKIPVKPSTQYVLSFSGSVGDGRILQYDASGNLIGSASSFTAQPCSFTTDAKCASIGFRYKFTETSGATVADSKAQMELGSTASTYEAYQGETYTIDLDGTRYGGTLDVTSGVLTVDRVCDSFTWADGTNAVDRGGGYTSKSFALSATPKNTGGTGTGTSTNINGVYAYNTAGDLHYYLTSTTLNMFLPTSTAGTQAIQVSYLLADPVTVQLTAEQVTTLLGQNCIFADCGDVSCQYRADTKLYIQKILNA